MTNLKPSVMKNNPKGAKTKKDEAKELEHLAGFLDVLIQINLKAKTKRSVGDKTERLDN